MRLTIAAAALLSLMGLLAACAPATVAQPATPTPTVEEPTSLPSLTEPPATTVPEEATPVPETPSLPEAQRVAFSSEDGTPLVGIYYPPAVGPAPGVLLMHQMGVDKEIWEPLLPALRGQEGAARPGSGYAVFAFDFPAHGESGGEFSDQAALAAARTALALMRTFEGVDADHIALIGASIGADAAVDECNEGCVGAVSISPGSYLGVDYQQALADLQAEKDPPVLCIASREDFPSPATCQSGETVGLADYQVHIYEGNVHGNYLFFEEDLTPPPLIRDLIVQWLAERLPPVP